MIRCFSYRTYKASAVIICLHIASDTELANNTQYLYVFLCVDYRSCIKHSNHKLTHCFSYRNDKTIAIIIGFVAASVTEVTKQTQ